jgi:hypothetical protein
LVSFGVAPKQKDRARQAFERSALFAGYLNSTKDRLVQPIVNGGTQIQTKAFAQAISEASVALSDAGSQCKPVRVDDPSEEKLIRGMLDRLPALGEPWPVQDRARWLRRFAHNLAMVYDPDDDTEIEVTVMRDK